MKRLLLLVLPLLLAACDSDESDPITVTSGVLVASQGAFGADDGGLAVYDPAAEQVQEVYGDLYVQSVAVDGDRLYLSSLSRVDVLDAESFALAERYNGVPNARYFAFDGERTFVTTLFDEAFDDGGIVALDGGEVAAETQIGGNPDGVAVVGQRVYVANYDFGAGRTVTVLDTETLAEVERIEVGCDAPRLLFVDAQEEIVVVCTGATDFDTNETTNGAVVVLDGASGDIVTRVALPTPVGTASVGQDAQYAAGTEEVHIVYDAGRTIYRFDTASNALTATLDVGGAQINAVAYDALGGALYVGRLDPDAPFTARGSVTIHDRDGTETGRFDAGVVPSHIAFLRSED